MHQGRFVMAGALGADVSDAEKAKAAAILKAYADYTVANQINLAGWAQALAFRHAIGFANCDDLTAYNESAINGYSSQILVLSKLRAGGVPPSALGDPPLPPLFGTKATINAIPGSIFPKFEFELDCEPGTNLARPTVSMHGNLCPVSEVTGPDVAQGGGGGTVQGTLGLAQFVAACAFAPFGCILSGLVIGGVAAAIYFTTPTIAQLVRSVLNSEGEINRLMQDTTAARERVRAEAITKCISQHFTFLKDLPLAERASRAASVQAACAAANPRIVPPPAARSIFLTVIPLVLVLGGLYATYWYVHPSRREKRERQALPRARAQAA